MRGALQRAWAEKSRPTFIVGKTIMGKGAVRADGSKYEGSPKLHGVPLSKTEASVEKTIQTLGGDPANPFLIFPEVKEAMNQVLAEKSQAAAEAKYQAGRLGKAEPRAGQEVPAILQRRAASPRLRLHRAEAQRGHPRRLQERARLPGRQGREHDL